MLKTISGNAVIVEDIWGNRILGTILDSNGNIIKRMVWFKSGRCCLGTNQNYDLLVSQ